MGRSSVSRESRYGVPVPNLGHNKAVSWNHHPAPSLISHSRPFTWICPRRRRWYRPRRAPHSGLGVVRQVSIDRLRYRSGTQWSALKSTAGFQQIIVPRRPQRGRRSSDASSMDPVTVCRRLPSRRKSSVSISQTGVRPCADHQLGTGLHGIS